jgi:hypothetical protein
MYVFRPYGASHNLADCGSKNVSPLAGLQTLSHSIHVLVPAAR